MLNSIRDTDVVKPKMLSPLTLAFVGDAVFDLLIRMHLSCKYLEPVAKLDERKAAIVCCKSQSKAVDIVLKMLNEDELVIYKRGRNSHPKHFPKNSPAIDYCRATGLECLFGYLYLLGDIDRINHIIKEVYKF